MGAHQRMEDVRILRLDLVAEGDAAVEPGLHQMHIAVVQDQAVQGPLARRRQGVPGGAEVGQQGVGAFGRHLHRIEHGAHHRLGGIGAIGVPADAVVVGADGLAVHLAVGEHIDVRIARQGEVAEGVPFRLAEAPDEGDQVVRRQALAPQHDGAVQVEGPHHLVQGRVVRRRQVHVQDLCAEAGLQLPAAQLNGEIHRKLLSAARPGLPGN